jgi:hypothetical protein
VHPSLRPCVCRRRMVVGGEGRGSRCPWPGRVGSGQAVAHHGPDLVVAIGAMVRRTRALGGMSSGTHEMPIRSSEPQVTGRATSIGAVPLRGTRVGAHLVVGVPEVHPGVGLSLLAADPNVQRQDCSQSTSARRWQGAVPTDRVERSSSMWVRCECRSPCGVSLDVIGAQHASARSLAVRPRTLFRLVVGVALGCTSERHRHQRIATRFALAESIRVGGDERICVHLFDQTVQCEGS